MAAHPTKRTYRQKRSIPSSLWMGCLFGGFENQFGWAFFGFGMIFAWLVIPAVDFHVLAFVGADVDEVEGKSIATEETAYETGSQIHAVRFTFTIGDTFVGGKTYERVSYGGEIAPGKTVHVEYPKGKPDLARIKGMSGAPFNLWACVVLLLPISGLLVIFLCGVKKGLKTIHLCQIGEFAKGKLVAKEGGGEGCGYEFTFRYETDDGQTHEIQDETNEPQLLEDDEFEDLIYDPLHPDEGVMLDTIPGQPKIDSRGEITCESDSKVLILPFVSLLGHGGYALYRFFG